MSKTFKHQMTKIRNSQTGEFESMPTLKGADGITPHIGTNGNWWIGNIDTGVNSHGEKGDAGVTPHIGENGHWYIGDTDTGVTAQGKDYVLTDNDKTEIASMVDVKEEHITEYVENPYDDSAVKKDISDLKAGKVDKSDYSPDDKTSDMTQPVGKDGNGKLWTKPSGEGTSITEQDVANWGFTKNEGTYVKPADGIPASDLADGVIPDVSSKLDKPQNTPEIGKILKVLSVNDDGTFTCEWADAPSGGGSDGKSAYQYALEGGYTGTEEEFTQKMATEYLTTETDPTVPDWAKEPQKPSYTASEVGAEPTGTSKSKVSAHNTAGDAHNDIRELITGLTTRLNTLADSDDETLDQMSEVVAYIKSNKNLIDAITTSKVSVSDIIDNLTTNASNKPLSAAQGVALKALIDAIAVPTKLSELENDSGYAKATDIPEKLPNPQKLTFTGAVTAEYDGSGAVTVEIPREGDGSTGNDITITKLASGTIPSGTGKVFTHTGITFGKLNDYKRIAIFVLSSSDSGSDWAITHNEDNTAWKMIDLTSQRGYIEFRKVTEHIWDALFKTRTNSSSGFRSSPYAPGITNNSGYIAGTSTLNFADTQDDEICIYNKSKTSADVNWLIQGMNF